MTDDEIAEESRKAYSQDDRDEMAKSGEAMPDGSYPIKNEADLKNATHLVGNGGASKAAVKAHIIKRAKALGLTSLIPDGWEQNSGGDELEQRRRQRASELDGAREVRHFDAQNVEIRETSDGMFRFSGYASITEHPYEVADFTETISRGAFKRTLNESPDVVLLVNHGEGGGLPLARTKSGTMTLVEDARGLRVDADLNPNDPDVRSLVPKMQRGDVDQMSFAFRATDQDWSEDYTKRTIRSVALHRGDVSIVTMGANPATTSSVSALRSMCDELEQRAGKSLSSKNRTALASLRDAIDNLLDSNDQTEEPMGVAADERAEAPVVEAEPVEDVADAAPARVRNLLDYTTSARAWLDSQREVA